MEECGCKGCNNKATHVGMCRTHWDRMKKYGSPFRVSVIQYHGLTLKDRLMKRVVIQDNGCWLYVGSTNHKGYGMLSVNSKPRLASRVSYQVHKGDIPDGMFVCHKCDLPLCVNPDHLFLGSQTDNMRDMMSKGRNNQPKGEKSLKSKLTDEQVREIRNSTEPQNVLANKYGVGRDAIYKIRKRITWTHVE